MSHNCFEWYMNFVLNCFITVFGFRGDLEILGYNLLHWLNGSLPWEKDISNAAVVEKKKDELMKNPAVYIKKLLPNVTEGVIIIIFFLIVLLFNYIVFFCFYLL